MNFDAAAKCCIKTSHGSAHCDTSEENTPTSRQAIGVHSLTMCLPAVLQEVKDENAQGTIYVGLPENGNTDIQRPAEASLPPERVATNGSVECDSSTSKLAAYSNTAGVVSRVEETTDDNVGTPLSISSQDTAALRRAINVSQTSPSVANAETPNEPSMDIEAGNAVTVSALAGADNSECVAVSASKLWTEFLNASIPTDMRAYEELFRRCISPAASASPTLARKASSTTDPPRKSSTGTDDGNSSLSRFETLSTQPSHARLCADDVSDDSLPLVLAAPLTSPQEHGQEMAQCPARGTADGEGDKDHVRTAVISSHIDTVDFPGDQQHAEDFVPGRGAEREEITDNNGPRLSSSSCGRHSDMNEGEKGARLPNVEEQNAPLLQLTRDTCVQGSRVSATGGALSALLTTSDGAAAPVADEPKKASNCMLLTQVASVRTGGKGEAQESCESTTPLRVDEGRKERSVADTNSSREQPTPTGTQASCVQSTTPREDPHMTQLDASRERGDAANCSNASPVAPAAMAPAELAYVEVAAHGAGGARHAAESEEEGPYVGAGDRHGGTGENTAVTGCGALVTSAVSDGRRSTNASSAADATPTPAALTGISTSGESKTSRAGVLGGEASTHVGARGRPSLGAAGRQLLLDRIRAKYHTNVGLYSGVLRKNYNSTISKLPFFTVSLLHRLAADFGIDTNAVLEQQHYDSARGQSSRHSADTAYPGGGRGARQGAGSAHAKGSAGSNGEFCRGNSSTAETRSVIDNPQDTNASPEKRRSRPYVESLSRRRALRATKKSESTGDGTLDAPPVERAEDVCEALGICGRSLACCSIRTSWGCEATENNSRRSPDQQQEMAFREETTRLQGGLVSPDYDGGVQQRKFNFGDCTNAASGPRGKEERAAETEAWINDHVLCGGVTSISPASGTIAHTRALATERRREQLGEYLPADRDELHAKSASSCTAATELLGSCNLARVPDDHSTGEKWRTVPKMSLLLREQRRDQHRFHTASANAAKDEGNGGHKPVGDLHGMQSSSVGEAPPITQKTHVNRWLSVATAPPRPSGGASLKEDQNHSALEPCTSALSYLRRPGASENAACPPWTQDARTPKKEYVGITEEKGRVALPANATVATESSSGIICGSPAGEESSTRAHTILRDGVTLAGLPDTRYLWSVLFGHLQGESSHSHSSGVVGQESSRTAAAGAKGEESSPECRPSSERLLPHSTAAVSQQLDLTSKAKWGLHGTPSLHSGEQASKEMLAQDPMTPAGTRGRLAAEDGRLCRSREQLPGTSAGTNDKTYGNNPAETVPNAFVAILGTEPGVAGAHGTDVQRAHARAAEAEHLRKKIKTEARWAQHEGETQKARPAAQPQLVSSNPNAGNHVSYAGRHDTSILWGERRVIVDEERILELLARRGQDLVTGLEDDEAHRADPQETAAACFLQKSSSCTVKRGTIQGMAPGEAIDCRSSKTDDSNSPEGVFASRRVHDGDTRTACAEEREVGWNESLQLQSKFEFVVRAGCDGSNGRDPTTQVDGRLASNSFLRAPLPALADDVDGYHRYQNKVQSSLVRQHGEQCRRQLLLPAASRRQNTASGAEPGEPHETSERTVESAKFSRQSSISEPLWSASLNVKTTANTSSRPAPSVASHVAQHLTGSRAPALSTSCETNSGFTSCNHGSYPLGGNELKRQQQPSRQHQRHQALLCDRDRLATLGDARGRLRDEGDIISEVGAAAPRMYWLSRGAAKNETIQNAYPSTANSTHRSGMNPATEETSACKDAWPSNPEMTAHKVGSVDIIPLVSLLIYSLLADEPTRASDTNASANSRYASRVATLLQTLSELQKRLASMQLPTPSPPQQTAPMGENSTAEVQHAFISSPSSGPTPYAKENMSPLQSASSLDLSGWLSSLVPALLQKAGDRYNDTSTTVTRPRVDVSVQQSGSHANQPRHGKQDADGGSGHGCRINDKNRFDWNVKNQDIPSTCGMSHHNEVGEANASDGLRLQEPTHTPLALELVESFLKAQGFNGDASSVPDERIPSTAVPRQDRVCAHGNSSTEKSTSETSVAASGQGLAEGGPMQRAAVKKHGIGHPESISDREETFVIHQREGNHMCSADGELEKPREYREV